MSKTVVVTGAASGIGFETAKHLADLGWRVGMIDLRHEDLVTAAEKISSPNLALAQADVTDEQSFAQALETICADGSGLNAIFNNAGIAISGQFEEMDIAANRKIVEVNTIGVINGCHLAYPLLSQTPGLKHVINMSSASSIHGVPYLSAYGASKAFVTNLTEALNIEWAPRNISVSCIQVPFVKTPMIQQEEPMLENMVRKRGAKVAPHQIAQLVASILATDKVGKSIHCVSSEMTMLNWAKRLLPRSVMRSVYANGND
ncbi:SDR family NAD(P)-dependent oxidoreductase [Pyruvatibacter sp.]|uniref:SDR family NAD(P)-dependent oxidoreductase n=1 Tax=Pyruvatibacter sp. TaxID=1981328 RepID=UPI0032634CFC